MRLRLIPATVALCIAGGFVALNLKQNGPATQTESQNYLARWSADGYLPYRGKTYSQLWRGWPLGISWEYPQGYISPVELLPWDVDPIYRKFSYIGLTFDGIVGTSLSVLTYCGFAYLARRTWGRVSGDLSLMSAR